jgi:hypothetical protein
MNRQICILKWAGVNKSVLVIFSAIFHLYRCS